VTALEVAAHVLVKTLEDPSLDSVRALEDLRAALEPDATPIYRFGGEDEHHFIPGFVDGAQGLRVVFSKKAVGLLPEGFPGLCLSYPAALVLLAILDQRLKANAGSFHLAGEERICPICQGELDPEAEGPECDDTGCPGRYDGEPIEA
jgi:hypothetical protein